MEADVVAGEPVIRHLPPLAGEQVLDEPVKADLGVEPRRGSASRALGI